MNLRAFLTLFLSICLLAGSCRKLPTKYVVTNDYFLYGRVGGFTTPDALAIYFIVNNGMLRKDESQLRQSPPENINDFNFHIICPATQHNGVADLPGTIPQELLALNNTTVGTLRPDVGYTDMRASINGKNYRWRFESNLDSVSSSIQEFYNRCNISFR